MAFIPTTDGGLVVCNMSYGEERWSNHIWFRKNAFVEGHLQQLVEAVKQVYINVLLNDFSVSTSMDVFKAYDMRSIDGPVVSDSFGVVPCTGGTLEMPPNCACVLTLYTAKRGRSHRGRMFIGPFTEEALEDGEWNASIIQQVNQVGTDLKAATAALGWIFGVRSGQLDKIQRDPALIEEIVSTTVRSARIGSQRRRIDRG